METLNEIESELTEIVSDFYARQLLKLPSVSPEKDFRPVVEERTMESTRKVQPEDVRIIEADTQRVFPPAPTITSILPVEGGVDGGTNVTVKGTHFLDEPGLQTRLWFDTSAATDVVIVNETTLTAKTPPHTAGSVNVRVENLDGQTDTLPLGYKYLPNPTLSSIVPNNGPVSGGTAVTINGTNFVSGATVSFGGNAATSVVFVSASKITCVTPAHAAGAVNVLITNPSGQTVTMTNGFTYNAPTISSITPPYGDIAGGTAISINGANFVSITSVTIGGTSVGFSVPNQNTITCTTPAHSNGFVNIVVTNSFGDSVTKINGFRYQHTPNNSASWDGSGMDGFITGQIKTINFHSYHDTGATISPYTDYQGWITVTWASGDGYVSITPNSQQVFVNNGVGTFQITAFNSNSYPPVSIGLFHMVVTYNDYPAVGAISSPNINVNNH